MNPSHVSKCLKKGFDTSSQNPALKGAGRFETETSASLKTDPDGEQPIPAALTEAVDWFLGEPSSRLVKLTPDGIELLDGGYVIGCDRITSPMDLVKWARHLADKTWITREHIGSVIDHACRAKGWEPRGL